MALCVLSRCHRPGARATALALAALLLVLWAVPGASAADPYTAGPPHAAGDVRGAFPGAAPASYPVRRVPVVGPQGQAAATAYGLEAERAPGRGAYAESASAPGVRQPGHVMWLLHRSYPAVTPADLAAAAGVPGLTADEAAVATQAALWHAAAGFAIDPEKPLGPASVQAGLVPQRVTACYAWLVEHAMDLRQTTVLPSLSLRAASGAAGSVIGPMTVATADGSAAALRLSSRLPLTYADGSAVDLRAVPSGKPFFLQAPAAPGSLTITATATKRIPSTRLFTSAGAQTLLAPGTRSAEKAVQATVAWTAAQAPGGGTVPSPTAGPVPPAGPGTPVPPAVPVPAPGSGAPAPAIPPLPQTEVPTPVPSAPPAAVQPDLAPPPLAQTGQEVVTAAWGALALIAAGAAVLLLRRRVPA